MHSCYCIEKARVAYPGYELAGAFGLSLSCPRNDCPERFGLWRALYPPTELAELVHDYRQGVPRAIVIPNVPEPESALAWIREAHLLDTIVETFDATLIEDDEMDES